MLRLSLHGILGFSTVLLRTAIVAGVAVSGSAFFYLSYIVFTWLQGDAVRGWASTAGLLALLGGIQLLTLGVLGEYVGRIFNATLNRPHFVVRDELGEIRSQELGSDELPS